MAFELSHNYVVGSKKAALNTRAAALLSSKLGKPATREGVLPPHPRR